MRVALARSLAVPEEPEERGGPEVDAPVADLDAGGQVEAGGVFLRREILPLGPDRDLVGPAVAVGVLEDLDAVARLLALLRAAGVLEALDDPEPAAFVHGEGDGVDDVGLGGEDLDLPARRHLEALDRL